jgi:DNA-directed RNA polymerase
MESSKLYSKEGLEREHSLERESVAIGVKKYRDAIDNKEPLSQLKPGAALIDMVIGPMSAAIREFCISGKATGPKKKTVDFLKEFRNPDEVAFITTKRIINSLTDHAVSVQTVAVSLAGMLKEQLQYNAFKEEHPGYLFRVEENLKQSTLPHRLRVLTRAENLLKVNAWSWNEEITRLHIGMDLISLFVKTAIAEDGSPLVEIEKSRSLGRRKKTFVCLRPTEATLKWLEWAQAEGGGVPPMYYPMVIPPKDWGTTYAGGFVCSEALPTSYKLIKTKDSHLLKFAQEGGMEKVFSAVNALQDTPWRINRRIFEVFNEEWRAGGDRGGLPSRDPEPDPPKTWLSYETPSDDELKLWKRKKTETIGRNVHTKSKRVAVSIARDIAKKFFNEPELYFVWSMDWRGRLYPVQSFINPQSDDLGRSLIEFAEGRELGENGAFWLAVHGANCFGIDKVSFEERREWVYANAAGIRDSAKNPLDGSRFWCEAENPYQFLAFCFEWSDLIQHATADTSDTFVSHLCVGMDGSCNGLQNFSALLRDEVGGAATNLVPGDKPRDIYQEVADVLNRIVNADAGSNDQHIRENARVWQGKITRKVTKRGVMTTPYGSKRFGLRAQLHVELEKIAPNYLKVDDDYPPINYLSKRLYEAIREVVIAAGAAMDWLQVAARIMSHAERPILWDSPAGFPVIQDYRVPKLQQVSTIFGGVRYQCGIERETEKIDRKRSSNAISPNFIHSLDASHLMLTVNACRAEGITSFGMVHDSYGTHAGSIDTMNRLLRKTFIEMYSDDVFGKFRQAIIDQNPGQEVPALPPPGSLNLSEVADSCYFFA